MEASRTEREPAALRLARDLRDLKARCDAVPFLWNPEGICLVRIVIDPPMRDTVKDATALRAFLGRTGFAIAGATLPTVRLFRAWTEELETAASDLERRPEDVRGRSFIERYVGLQPYGDVRGNVGRQAAGRHLEICHHHVEGDDGWSGIEAMLMALGGTGIRRWEGVPGLGYGSVAIDHAKATEIAKHPLVRHVDVVPRLVASR